MTMATDDELNPTSWPKFTKSTSARGAISPFAYVDMRGNVWRVHWDLSSQTWSAQPLAAVYGLPANKLAFFGEKAGTLIDSIEAAAERYRIANRGSLGWLWLLVIGYVVTRKGRK